MQFNARKRALFKSPRIVAVNNLLPWTKDSQTFIDNCTQCGNCIPACPEKIIAKGDGGYPCIDFNLGECVFCAKCAQSCEQSIFTSSNESPWLQTAVIDNNCLAIKDIYCRSCSESCESQALTFKLGHSAIPQIDINLCTGCGACVAPCPTQAITIRINDEKK